VTASTECPRCKLTLNPTTYEGATVHGCDGCWGFWVPAASLRTILASKDEAFSDAERKQVEDQTVGDVEGDAEVACLECGKTLQKRVMLGSVLVDFCPGHGVWLDTGEIKSIQVLAEIEDSVRRWLLDKVGC
jgi:Zn-finger nucleic acid-binding protein